MTTNRRAQIKISQRRGRIFVAVRHGWLDLEGLSALIIIAIILAARFMRVIVRLLVWLVCWIVPIIVRFAAHYSTGLVLWFRAFYTE
jgi:hypothetical protein